MYKWKDKNWIPGGRYAIKSMLTMNFDNIKARVKSGKYVLTINKKRLAEMSVSCAKEVLAVNYTKLY
ncbi:hypothetical protein L798_08356 [Zootermopsis nevadensis]|uniref:Uncharacterized protein n=1 Tax=Zootermopsis nevadensis TaxID=136037 RepID=A0A067R5Q8_ZOONE|nr:hypothetical protein L798_08356 [Zootermopsis nevadensis]